MRVALICSGLGNVKRGHETFARETFNMLRDEIDITLFKGGGEDSESEITIPNLARGSSVLCFLKDNLRCSNKRRDLVDDGKRTQLELETFAYNVLPRLFDADFDIVHCPDAPVMDILYRHRDFCRKRPRFLYANGGAGPQIQYPGCDFIQHHSEYSFSRSGRRSKDSFIVPCSVNTDRFRPESNTSLRSELGIPEDVFLVLSVGTIGDNHKRMSHLISEVSALSDDVHLLILGQQSSETTRIKNLGKELLGERVHFGALAHGDLHQAYAAADTFVLCSLFEAFGIVYIEAMASGLPVIATNHKNQRWLMGDAAILVDMKTRGLVAANIRKLQSDRHFRSSLGNRAFVRAQRFSQEQVKPCILEMYQESMRRPLPSPKKNAVQVIKKRLKRLIK